MESFTLEFLSLLSQFRHSERSEESQSGFFVAVAPQNDTKLLNFNPMSQTKISDDKPLNNLDTDEFLYSLYHGFKISIVGKTSRILGSTTH